MKNIKYLVLAVLATIVIVLVGLVGVKMVKQEQAPMSCGIAEIEGQYICENVVLPSASEIPKLSCKNQTGKKLRLVTIETKVSKGIQLLSSTVDLTTTPATENQFRLKLNDIVLAVEKDSISTTALALNSGAIVDVDADVVFEMGLEGCTGAALPEGSVCLTLRFEEVVEVDEGTTGLVD
ncbi:MAG: hypothetical protein RR313_00015 [Anaerovoracaceae bacterium]